MYIGGAENRSATLETKIQNAVCEVNHSACIIINPTVPRQDNSVHLADHLHKVAVGSSSVTSALGHRMLQVKGVAGSTHVTLHFVDATATAEVVIVPTTYQQTISIVAHCLEIDPILMQTSKLGRGLPFVLARVLAVAMWHFHILSPHVDYTFFSCRARLNRCLMRLRFAKELAFRLGWLDHCQIFSAKRWKGSALKCRIRY